MSKGSKPYSPEFIEEVKQTYLATGESLAAIAKRFSVGQRTVEGWASEGGWSDLRKAQKVVPIGEAKKSKPKPKPQPLQTSPASTLNPQPIHQPRRSPRNNDGIDELQIVDTAICDVSGMMGMASLEDMRSLGSLATGLCRLIELRLKLQPKTAAELAEQAIALGISPREFVSELERRWQLRA